MRRAPALSALLLMTVACTEAAPPSDTPPPDAPPPTDFDIWIAPLNDGPDGLMLGDASNATRRPGYDNQPSFLPDGTILYTRQEGGTTDIWRLDPVTGRSEAVTATSPESEYSPTPLPGGDGFSVIQVEPDSTQRLWRFAMDGGEPAVIFPDVAPVGYHAWADERHALLFVLGQPATLRLATVGEPGSSVKAEGIGRSLQKVPGARAVSYVLHTGQGVTEIRVWDVDADRSRLVTDGFQGGDHHAWTPGGVLLQGGGNRLFAFRPGEEGWREIGRLPEGLDISRLAVSADGATVAMVVESPAEG